MSSTSKELQISTSKLEKMSSSELEAYAEEKSKFILEKIELSTQRINGARVSAKYAANMKSGLFGKTKRKADATANAVIATNEAVAEMNELLQESIRFTCLSLSFAQAMSKHMSALIVNGFKTRDGDFIKLSSDSEEQATYIVQQAEAFAKNQLEVEMKQEAQASKIENLADKVSENENRLNEKDNLDSKQSAYIAANRKRLDEKDIIDAEQSKRLEELGAILNNKDLVDQKQEEAISKNTEAIKVLFEYTKQKDILDKEQSEEIEKIKATSSKKLSVIAIIISSLAIIGSIVNIIFKFIM